MKPELAEPVARQVVENRSVEELKKELKQRGLDTLFLGDFGDDEAFFGGFVAGF